MIFAFASNKYSIVGRLALILVSSSMFPSSSIGTLKSTLTSTLLPFKSTSLRVFFLKGMFASFKNQSLYPHHQTQDFH